MGSSASSAAPIDARPTRGKSGGIGSLLPPPGSSSTSSSSTLPVSEKGSDVSQSSISSRNNSSKNSDKSAKNEIMRIEDEILSGMIISRPVGDSGSLLRVSTSAPGVDGFDSGTDFAYFPAKDVPYSSEKNKVCMSGWPGHI